MRIVGVHNDRDFRAVRGEADYGNRVIMDGDYAVRLNYFVAQIDIPGAAQAARERRRGDQKGRASE